MADLIPDSGRVDWRENQLKEDADGAPYPEDIRLMCQACGEVFDDLQIAYGHSKEHEHMTNNSGDLYGFVLGTEEDLM